MEDNMVKVIESKGNTLKQTPSNILEKNLKSVYRCINIYFSLYIPLAIHRTVSFEQLNNVSHNVGMVTYTITVMSPAK